MGPIGCPKTSVRKYHYSLRNNPEERSSHALRSGNLQSRQVLRSALLSADFDSSWVQEVATDWVTHVQFQAGARSFIDQPTKSRQSESWPVLCPFGMASPFPSTASLVNNAWSLTYILPIRLQGLVHKQMDNILLIPSRRTEA